MSRPPPDHSDLEIDGTLSEMRMKSLLDDIEQEEAPERLLNLARELQRQLTLRKQRRTPN